MSEKIMTDIIIFLLLLPKAILSDPVGVDYEQYIHDAHRHYQAWLDITSPFHWPVESCWVDNTASSTHSYDSRPEDDLHFSQLTFKDDDVFHTKHSEIKAHGKNYKNPDVLDSKTISENNKTSIKGDEVYDTKANSEKVSHRKISGKSVDEMQRCCTEEDVQIGKIGKCGKPASQCPFSQRLVLRSRDLTSTKSQEDEPFYEGPFLGMIFDLLSNVPNQSYQINLQLTSLISKLAMLPHPNLHEYLLNPMLPTAKNTRTLFKTLQDVCAKLTMEIPRVRNYAKIIENTRLQLMGEDRSYDENEDHNQLFEGLIVVEEFCKELAAIVFVKYQHQVHSDR